MSGASGAEAFDFLWFLSVLGLAPLANFPIKLIKIKEKSRHPRAHTTTPRGYFSRGRGPAKCTRQLRLDWVVGPLLGMFFDNFPGISQQPVIVRYRTNIHWKLQPKWLSTLFFPTLASAIIVTQFHREISITPIFGHRVAEPLSYHTAAADPRQIDIYQDIQLCWR
jgi:hypothetical protein